MKNFIGNLVGALLVAICIGGWIYGWSMAASEQKPLDRFLIRSYTDGASGLTLHVVQEHKGEGCWLFAESSRGLAVVQTGVAVCYPNEDAE